MENGPRVLHQPISRFSRAVDLIEKRSQQNRPLKIVKVRICSDNRAQFSLLIGFDGKQLTL
jgi:hypothetical protein